VNRTYYTQDAAREMRRALDRIRETRDVHTARAIAAEAVKESKWNGHGRLALNPTEQRVFEAFLGHYRAHGIPPSHFELSLACGFKTKRAAQTYLRRLHAKGHLVPAPGGRFLPA
jgi:hypothetical protein